MATYLITGATGFLGSHLVEGALVRGHTVRALVRPTTDQTRLKQFTVELVPGDLNDRDAIANAVAGVDVVLHAAAKVGDWGPVDEYRNVNVEGLRLLLEAIAKHPVKRFVSISSLGVYAARHHYGTDEGEPLPAEHIDGYTQSKAECERLALERVRTHNLPITILRPGFIYGPRDRSVLPRLVERLKERSIIYLARGRHALNTTYVGNIADACFLAAEHPKAVGEVFNITDGEFVSKRLFFETIADGLNLPRPRGSMPIWVARRLANWRERVFRRTNTPHPPRITQATLKFAGLNLDFSIAKARAVLGYEPKVGFAEGMAHALAWYRSTQIASTCTINS
jgi:2-alkyl-3-oxoalkanoate reductase